MNVRLSLSALVFIVAAAIAVIVTTSGGGTSKAQPLASARAAISVKQTGLGQLLTDANGRTLYLFAPDKRNLSTLSNAGRSVWPPFTATRRPSAIGGVQGSQIGSVSGPSTPAQVTYDGHPLYYFAGDHRPGQTAGQGLDSFGGRWYVLSAAGGAITAAGQAAGTTGSAAGAPSYGY